MPGLPGLSAAGPRRRPPGADVWRLWRGWLCNQTGFAPPRDSRGEGGNTYTRPMADAGLQRAREIAALHLEIEAGLAMAETREGRAVVGEAVAAERRKRAGPEGGSSGRKAS